MKSILYRQKVFELYLIFHFLNEFAHIYSKIVSLSFTVNGLLNNYSNDFNLKFRTKTDILYNQIFPEIDREHYLIYTEKKQNNKTKYSIYVLIFGGDSWKTKKRINKFGHKNKMIPS